MNKFYMVIREPKDGFNNIPTMVHLTTISAEAEAERLCKKEKTRFYVVTCTPHIFCEIPETPVVWKKA